MTSIEIGSAVHTEKDIIIWIRTHNTQCISDAFTQTYMYTWYIGYRVSLRYWHNIHNTNIVYMVYWLQCIRSLLRVSVLHAYIHTRPVLNTATWSGAYAYMYTVSCQCEWVVYMFAWGYIYMRHSITAIQDQHTIIHGGNPSWLAREREVVNHERRTFNLRSLDFIKPQFILASHPGSMYNVCLNVTCWKSRGLARLVH